MDLVVKQPGEILLVLVIFLAISGSTILSLFLTLGLLAVIEYYKVPKVSEDVSSRILHTIPSIIAHRGAGQDAPENTIAAFREAKKNGASAVEFDLAFTADGVPVIFHDDTMERTTNGEGWLNKLNYDYVRSLEASAKHQLRGRFPEEKIPTFEDAVQECLRLDLKMYIDVKSFGFDLDQTVSCVVGMYKRNPALYSMGIVCSFNPLVIYKVRCADQSIITGLTFKFKDRYMKAHGHISKMAARVTDAVMGWCLYAWIWYLCGSSCVLLNKDMISWWEIDHWKVRGYQVILWTVNDKRAKDFMLHDLGCHIMTDSLQR